MTFDYQHRHHWRHPRSMREAFGHELQPLRHTLTFLTCQHGSACAALVAIALLAALIVFGGY